MKKYLNIFIGTSLFLPIAVNAAEFSGMKELITATGGLISLLIKILVAVALLVFFWGLVKFIFRVGGDEKAVEGGRKLMIWGLIALFVMISVWGIIRFMQDALLLPLPSENEPILISV